MTIDAINQNDINSIRRDWQVNPELGVLGFSSDALAAVFVNGRPGYWWVRQIQAGGTYGPPQQVRGCIIPMKTTPGTPVKLGLVESEKAVLGPDFVGMLSQGVNPTQAAVVDPNANNPSFVNQSYITTAYGQIIEGTLFVGIRGILILASGTWYKLNDKIDISSGVPGAGDHCLAVIAVQNDYATLEVQFSTAKSMLIPLDMDDLQEAWTAMSDATTNAPLWAFELADGQSELIENNRWADLRQLINVVQSGGGSGTVTSVGLDLPTSVFDVTVTPITTSGDLTAIFVDQPANQVFAGPTTGADTTPDFRALVADDIPTLPYGPDDATYITQTPSAGLSAEQALSALATGYMKSAITTGVITTQAVPIPAADIAVLPIANLADAYKLMVEVALTTNISISSAPATIDGLSLSNGDRVLLVGQTTGAEKGLWVYNGTGNPLTRPTDFAAGSTLFAYRGITVYVRNGTANARKFYYLVTTGTVTIDTTSQTWSELSFTASEIQGGVLDVNVGGTGAVLGVTGPGIVQQTSFAGALSILTPGAAGHYPRSNGTNYVDNTIQATDISGVAVNLVAYTTLGADAANIDLTSISGSYKHLQLRLFLRSDRAATSDNVYIRFNNDSTASHYYSYTVAANGATVVFTSIQRLAATGTGFEVNTGAVGSTGPSNEFSVLVIDIFGYANTANNRIVTVNGYSRLSTTGGTLNALYGGGSWLETSTAISRLTILPVTGSNWKAGSSYMLYGYS